MTDTILTIGFYFWNCIVSVNKRNNEDNSRIGVLSLCWEVSFIVWLGAVVIVPSEGSVLQKLYIKITMQQQQRVGKRTYVST